ncbi:BufA2 family periplasmic bufferin-type metallophore [Duganella callida]|uniref:DUF2282 domain-containing protein n=1 Tax=Duganella callida TaxID=2561932 RepID=A0A4Y9SU79_9BURK|nr:hypothetical protein [Duganella callida]TFW28213.1 hypothetical protein E4L98_05770 [Duganella callida]
MSKTSRVGIAAASALLALASLTIGTSVHAADQNQKAEPLGRCYGINTCKGTSLCATAKNDCKGLNSCKGEGVLVRTKSACLAEGGTLTEPKK